MKRYSRTLGTLSVLAIVAVAWLIGDLLHLDRLPDWASYTILGVFALSMVVRSVRDDRRRR